MGRQLGVIARARTGDAHRVCQFCKKRENLQRISRLNKRPFRTDSTRVTAIGWLRPTAADCRTAESRTSTTASDAYLEEHTSQLRLHLNSTSGVGELTHKALIVTLGCHKQFNSPKG
ncbi:MAG: hypothetical protein AAF961_16745 [Planctomycetota bacterium]